MFDGAAQFKGDISRWNVSNVTKISRMFDGTFRFNQHISRWDVSSVILLFGCLLLEVYNGVDDSV